MAIADTSRATHYRFAIDPRNPLRIIFEEQEIFAPERAGEPAWQYEAPTLRLLDAMIRWLALRRERWNAWGELAECVGSPALDDHMRRTMTVEPVATRPCTVIEYSDDPTDLLIGEMTHGAQGFAVAPLHQHRFATGAARERFRDWINRNGDDGLDALVSDKLLEGPAALDASIDGIAAGHGGDLNRD